MKKIILLITIAFLVTSCSQGVNPDDKTPEDKEEETSEVEVKDPKDIIDLEVEPDESGKIMVLMYHNIGPEEDEWVRTPENFRKDLLTLYEKGYRTISLSDYVSGNITTEEGFTPIVLTFDDGNTNNFEYDDKGEIIENSAVGILQDFDKDYPDFNTTATFFLTGVTPFGQAGMEADKINYLLECGMDIGNHSLTHANYTTISKEGLQEEIGAQAQYLESFVKDDSYKVNTIALPYGSRPDDDSLTEFLRKGSFDGFDYENIAILNVGWDPAQSPYHEEFDFESIPRIRASEMKVDDVGMYNYLEYFDKNPDERFISDGFPEIITVPEEKVDGLTQTLDKEIYEYQGKNDEGDTN